jgi:hypothetical protein
MSFAIRGASYVQDRSHVNPDFDSYPEMTKKNSQIERTQVVPIANESLSLDEEKMTLKVELYAKDINSRLMDNISAYISKKYLGKVVSCKLIHSYVFDREQPNFISYAENNFQKKVLFVKVIAKTFMVKKDDVVQMILNVGEQRAYHTFVICNLVIDKKTSEIVDKKLIVNGVTYEDNKYVYVKISDVYLIDSLVIICKGSVVGKV